MFKPEQVGKRTRYTYAKINEVIKMPHLLDIQRKSYEWFLESGLQNIFNDISPIKDNSGNLVLSFEGFSLGEPKYDINECKNRDATYAAPLRVNIRLVNNDPETNKYLKVVFLENYGVTLAEKIMPAADVSEQISTAGKEASGTGNMKFMMNGAITIGTLDGANVEISELVGLDNCEIFGLKDEEVKNLKANNQYRAWDYYNNDLKIRRAIDSLTNGTFSSNPEEFKIIHDELMNKNDEYFLLADFESYANAQRHVVELYQDRAKWARICLVNIAKSGFFSSDRTIEQYVEDIWHLEKCKF